LTTTQTASIKTFLPELWAAICFLRTSAILHYVQKYFLPTFCIHTTSQ